MMRDVQKRKGNDEMGIWVNPGNDGFKSALNSKIYVDKTGLLDYLNSVIGTDRRFLCCSRPRRFGKSVTASMMTAYYSKGCDSKELFQSLKISQSKEFEVHLNKYHVIYLDIAYIRSQSKQAIDVIGNIRTKVAEDLKEYFPEYSCDSGIGLPDILWNINRKYGAAFVVIIDEWDALFREDKFDETAQKAYVELLRGLFKSEASKTVIKLAYLTGILPIKKYGKQSALNNFDEYTMTNPFCFSEYVGFTEAEVVDLCKEYEMDFAETKLWYDGYSFRRESHVYNPNSVVKAMFFGEYENYWTSTETYRDLCGYIVMNFDGLKDDVLKMMSGGRCLVDINSFENDMVSFQSKDDVLTVLIHLGYLAYDADRKEVYIPNYEVKSAFYTAVRNTKWNSVVKEIEASQRLLQATWVWMRRQP